MRDKSNEYVLCWHWYVCMYCICKLNVWDVLEWLANHTENNWFFCLIFRFYCINWPIINYEYLADFIEIIVIERELKHKKEA